MVEDGDIILFKFNAGAGLTDKKKKWIKGDNLDFWYVQFAKEEVECVYFVWHDADKTGATTVFI